MGTIVDATLENNGQADLSKKVILHGNLDLIVKEAKRLPNMDLMTERLRKCWVAFGSCTLSAGRNRGRGGRHKIITSDPYVSVCLAGATVAQTRVITNCENPMWDEHFHIPVAHPISSIEFQVKDNDVLGAQLIGIVLISVDSVLSGNTIEGWFPITGPHKSLIKHHPELHISLKFKSVAENPTYISSMSFQPDRLGVSNSYFPLRKGGRVTLYQDAHVPDNMLPEIPLEGGKLYQHEKCWEDICHAILEAHHLVYIVGWSIYHPVKLIREPTRPIPQGGSLSLGELLKYKSQEGVRVIMLIWDDKTSHDKFLLKTEGVMQTHDEETRKFFKHSTVNCVLSPRYASNKLSIFKQHVVGTLFSHHQKCVLVDTQGPGNNRKITAFIGGLDLCDGRYDTPEHRLFDDLQTVFDNDFHNPTFPKSCKEPRQPWHDLHCKVEGPAAYDIMTNFEQRWKKTKWKNFRLKKVTHWHDDVLINLERISWILTPSRSAKGDASNVYVTNEEDPESWHVQVFRSIDSGSVKGFPKPLHEAVARNLVCGKNIKIDKSIHTAYIHAIRSAQQFIYIENQYFIGSSYRWPSYKNAGADNLIPMEIALKIASKIKSHERFAVYIVIPMWPEGVPTSAAVQEILFWQGQTMEMMYNVIAQAIEEAGLSHENHPQDYLNFYCLGKREPASSEHLEFINQLGDSPLSLARKFRRFMIYVHAKGMIVDDEYVLIGSANINQRSLDGSRDTEIATGAYQPNYTWSRKKCSPHGQVYGYRMSLWSEHLGCLDNTFGNPQSLECVNHINGVADSNWKAYVANEYTEMKGHLLKYPVQVHKDGKVGPLPGYEHFPDIGGKVLGSHTTLPDALTT